jgi:hypothetical protein
LNDQLQIINFFFVSPNLFFLQAKAAACEKTVLVQNPAATFNMHVLSFSCFVFFAEKSDEKLLECTQAMVGLTQVGILSC